MSFAGVPLSSMFSAEMLIWSLWSWVNASAVRKTRARATAREWSAAKLMRRFTCGSVQADEYPALDFRINRYKHKDDTITSLRFCHRRFDTRMAQKERPHSGPYQIQLISQINKSAILFIRCPVLTGSRSGSSTCTLCPDTMSLPDSRCCPRRSYTEDSHSTLSLPE